MLQIRAADRTRGDGAAARRLGLGDCSFVVGFINARDEIAFTRNAKPVFKEKRVDLQRAWSETSFRMQQLRDNPECAQEEYDRILDAQDPGLSFQLTFEDKKYSDQYGKPNPESRFFASRASTARWRWRPRSRAPASRRWTCTCPTSSPGACTLDGFKGLAACGGFSYGDVLGGGQGWAKSILFNARARARVRGLLRRAATPSRSAPATAAR